MLAETLALIVSLGLFEKSSSSSSLKRDASIGSTLLFVFFLMFLFFNLRLEMPGGDSLPPPLLAGETAAARRGEATPRLEKQHLPKSI